jgi:cardiolipin synthase C
LKVILFSISLICLFSCSSDIEGRIENLALLKDFKPSCQVKILDSGREALLHRVQMIRSAKKSILLQTFIWTDDECGRIMIHELGQAAKRGVKVRIICDHLFSNQDSSSLAAISRIKNLEVKIYNPAGNRVKPIPLQLMIKSIGQFHKVNQRMHNKLIMVDSRDAICGGRNIENTYYDNALGLNFKDLDVAVRGPVTASMKKSFEQFWSSPISLPLVSLKDVSEKLHESTPLNLELGKNKLYSVLSQLLSNYNWNDGFLEVDKVAFFSDMPGKNDSKGFHGGSRLNNIIVNAVKNAKERIWIQSPYVVMSAKAQKILTEIRAQNEALEITISTNSLAATDSWQTYAFLYKQKKVLIGDLGIKMYEFKPLPTDLFKIMPNYSQLLQQMNGTNSLTKKQWQEGDVTRYPRLCLHSKCMLTDDDFSFVGSYNMDPRSANLNTELSVVIIDKNFNRLLANHIAKDIAAKNSWVVAKRKTIIGIKQIFQIISAINSVGVKVTGIDLWPRRYSACFQLREGATEVSRDHKDFYKNYISVGNFPRIPILGEKEIFTRLFKAFGKSLKSIL